MGLFEIVVLGIIFVYSIWVIKKKITEIKAGKGCGCGCGSCGKDCGMRKKDKN